jgi:DNA-binding transcriptional regulator YdaS (Cro superfamily)
MNSTKRTPTNEALERAIEHFGSLSEMARQLGVSGYQVIQQWRTSGRVPPQHCTKLAQLTGETREDLVGWPPLEDDSPSSDDVQNNPGGTVRKTKERKLAA